MLPRSRRYALSCAGAAAALTCFTSAAHAQTTLFWRSEAGNGNWSDANNWWNGAATQSPPGSEILRFDNNSQLSMTNDLVANPNRYRIYFDAGASSDRTVNGASPSTTNTFFDFGGVQPLIQNDSVATHTINFHIANGNTNGVNALDLVAVGGNLVFGGNISGSGDGTGSRRLYVKPAAGRTITVNGAVSDGTTGSMRLIKEEAGTVVVGGTNTYSGNTEITAGTFRLGASNVIPDGTGKGDVAINGTLDLNTFSETVNGLTGSGIIDTVAGGTSTLTVGGNNASSSFSGFIRDTTGTLGLRKIGTGTLTLSGAGNSHAGGLVISQGAVFADADGTLGTGSVTINDADTGANPTSLFRTGTGTINRNITVANFGTGTTTIGNDTGSTSITYSGSLTLNRTATLKGGGAIGSAIFSGAISGSGGVDITADAVGGVVRFNSPAKTYSGDTTISSNGLLRIGTAHLIPDGSGKGNVVVSGTLDLNGANEVINGLSGAGVVDSLLSGTPTLTVGNNNATSHFSGVIKNSAGTLALRKEGGGVLTLSGDNTYSGQTNVVVGTLQIGNGGTTGSVAGAINVGATVTFDRSDALSVGGIISGAGTLNQNGLGTLTLTGGNTFSGVTKINAGTLRVNSIAASGAQPLGTGGSDIQLSSATTAGTLEYGGGSAANLQRNLTVSGAAGGIIRNSGGNTLTLSGILTNDGRPLTLAGGDFIVTNQINGTSANSNVNVDGATVSLNTASSNYNGTTSVYNGGVLTAAVANALPSATPTAVVLGQGASGGKLVLGTASNPANQTVSGLSTSGTAGGANAVVGGNASVSTLTVNNSSDQAFAGTLGGAGTNENNLALTKADSGTLTLSGTNTYAGTTTVNGGTVAVTGSIANSATTVNAGATLKGSGTTGALTAASGATVSPGNSVGQLSTGNTTLNAGSTFVVELASAGTGSSTALGGSSVSGIPGTSYDTLRVLSGGTFTVDTTGGGTVTVQLNLTSSSSGFNPNQYYRWQVVNYENGQNGAGADPSQFTLSTAGFNDGNNAQPGPHSLFTIDYASNGGGVYINYAPTPEPTTTLLFGMGCGCLLVRRRRRRGRAARGQTA